MASRNRRASRDALENALLKRLLLVEEWIQSFAKKFAIDSFRDSQKP
jgi:hypothetical protein